MSGLVIVTKATKALSTEEWQAWLGDVLGAQAFSWQQKAGFLTVLAGQEVQVSCSINELQLARGRLVLVLTMTTRMDDVVARLAEAALASALHHPWFDFGYLSHDRAHLDVTWIEREVLARLDGKHDPSSGLYDLVALSAAPAALCRLRPGWSVRAEHRGAKLIRTTEEGFHRLRAPSRTTIDRAAPWIYLWNSSVFAEMLHYNRETGQHKQLYRRQLPASAKVTRGDHRIIDGIAYGVFGTPTGPVFFSDAEHYPLREGHSSARVTRVGPDENLFELYAGDAKVFSVRYPPVTNFGWDAYSSEEDMDLFLGLCEQLGKSSFFNFHTGPDDQICRAPLHGSEREAGDYLLVFDSGTGTFCESYRVVGPSDVLQQFPDIDRWTGFVPEELAAVLEAALGSRYADPRYRVSRIRAKEVSQAQALALH